jgi:hypothetical protein
MMKVEFEDWRDELNGVKPDTTVRVITVGAFGLVVVALGWGFGAFWGWW